MFKKEKKFLKHKCRGWCLNSSATAPLPSPSALPGWFHTWKESRKWEQRSKWPFFPAHHSFRPWLPPLNCPHWPFPSRFIFSQALSPIMLCQVPMAKAFLFSFCRLCWRRHYLGRICILLHSVLWWFWCAETTASCSDRYSLSSALWSLSYLYLPFLPLSSSVCELFAAEAFFVPTASFRKGSRTRKYKKLVITGIVISGQPCLKKPELGVNTHMILYSATLNLSKLWSQQSYYSYSLSFPERSYSSFIQMQAELPENQPVNLVN